MKLKNPKEKGSRLERKVASLIRQKGLDDNCKRMPLSGAFPHLREDIYTCLPVHIECKNQERVQFWKWYDELRSKTMFNEESVLVISGNHRPITATVDIEYLLNLWKIEQDNLLEHA